MSFAPLRPAVAAIAVAALTAACAPASARTVTPATLPAALADAKGGETLTLAAGDYGVVKLPARVFAPALTIDAAQARITGVVIAKSAGVSISGGTVTGEGLRYAVDIRDAEKVRIANMRITGATRGIVIHKSRDVTLTGNVLDGLRSDGINIALSRQVRVEGNECRNFQPQMAQFDNSGQMIRDGDHPDCIQAWSRPSAPPTSDLVIVNNVAEGQMQGVFLGNHVRNGVDDGGFDRVEIRGNRMKLSMPNGIVGSGLRGAVIRDNVIETIPGSMNPRRRTSAIRTKLFVEGADLDVCGNTVKELPTGPGTQKCR